MNFETTRLRGRPSNRWQDEVKKDGRLTGGIGWRERAHNREEWKKLLRMARNHCNLHKAINERKRILLNILVNVFEKNSFSNPCSINENKNASCFYFNHN